MPIDKHQTGSLAEFTLRRAATNGETSVDVVGDFNNWTPGANPMTAGADGWTCTLTVPVGKRYRFRYLLDGQRWETTGKPTTTSTTTTAAKTPSSTSPPFHTTDQADQHHGA